MIRFRTKSGAVYSYDTERYRVLREGPYSPGIDYDSVPDSEWSQVINEPDFRLGHRVLFLLQQGKYRITTSIEEFL